MKSYKKMLVGIFSSLLLLNGCNDKDTVKNKDDEQLVENDETVDDFTTNDEKEEEERLSNDIVVPNFSSSDEKLELELQKPLLQEDTVELNGDVEKKRLEGEELEKRVEEELEIRLGNRKVEDLEKIELGGDEYYLLNEDTKAEQTEFSMVSPKGIIMKIESMQKLKDSIREELTSDNEKDTDNEEEYNVDEERSKHFLKNTLYYMKKYVSDDLINSGIGRLTQLYEDKEEISSIKFELIINNLKSSIELIDTYDEIIRQNFYSNGNIGANWIAFKEEVDNQKDVIESIDSYEDLIKHGDKLNSTELAEYGYAFIYGVEQFIGYNYKPILSEETE